jgi:hypothetical protein
MTHFTLVEGSALVANQDRFGARGLNAKEFNAFYALDVYEFI